MNEGFSKFFCAECGKWLGVKSKTASTEGIFPYCPRCKKQVPISVMQHQRLKKSAECQQQ